MQTFRVVTVAVLAAGFLACSSSSSHLDAGPQYPTTPVTLSVPASAQTQTVQVPQASGPVTGIVDVPPITTDPADASGDLSVSFLSGTSVAFERTAPPASQSFARQPNSNATLPGGPYIFEMTVSAPFDFTLESVPAFTLNLGTLNAPDAAYVLVVQNGTSAPFQFLTASRSNAISFPGTKLLLTVAAGDVLKFGFALASNVPSAPIITSFTASPSSLDGGGSVTLAWSVSGATVLSIDNGVGAVTPTTAGTVTPSVAASTTFTLTATNANASTTANASVCVATGAVTATVTSPSSYTMCTDSFLTSIVMTNASCEVVTITVIGFVSAVSGVGTCGFNGPNDYTSANANLPFSVDAGATETVFDLTNGGIGCCTTQPCTISCNDTLEWTLTTNIGPVSALSPPFDIAVSGCNLPCPP